MTTFSIRCSEELKERLLAHLENENTGNEKAEKIAKALVNAVNNDRYEQEQRRLQSVNENLQLVNENLQKEIEKYGLQTSELQALIAQKEAQISEIQGVADDLQVRLQKAEACLQSVNAENVLTFKVPEPANSLLGEYARRLQIAPQAILIDMFVRYVTEQYNHWFFDFAVKKSEFKEVCGYSHAEVTNWLNAQK